MIDNGASGVPPPVTDGIAYTVDPFGRRIAREHNGQTTHQWLYQSFLQPIQEIRDGVSSRFVYATGMNVPDYMIRDGETYRLVTDIRGSVRLVVSASTGEIVQRMDYDEWGNVLQDTNPGFQPFGFAGGHYDPDTGLVRFGYRDYDPDTGRWTAKDPILFNGGQANLYLYCYGKPVHYKDLDGLAPHLIGRDFDGYSIYGPDVDWGSYDPIWGGKRRSSNEFWELTDGDKFAAFLMTGPFMAYGTFKGSVVLYKLMPSWVELAYDFPNIFAQLPFVMPAATHIAKDLWDSSGPSYSAVLRGLGGYLSSLTVPSSPTMLSALNIK